MKNIFSVLLMGFLCLLFMTQTSTGQNQIPSKESFKIDKRIELDLENEFSKRISGIPPICPKCPCPCPCPPPEPPPCIVCGDLFKETGLIRQKNVRTQGINAMQNIQVSRVGQ